MGYTVCIDAGQGKNAFGRSSPDTTFFEWEFTRDIVKRMCKILKKYPEIKVVLSAKTDEDIDIPIRTKIAEKNKADIIVSIHANSFGTEWNTNNGWIVYSPYDTEQSKKLANALHKESVPFLGLTDLGVKVKPNLYMFQCTKIPTAIVRHGYYTNRAEVNVLKSAEFREKCAIANVKGILRYFDILWREPVANEKAKLENDADDKITRMKMLINNDTYTIKNIIKDRNIYVSLYDLQKAGFKIGYDYTKKIFSVNCPHVSTITPPVSGANYIHYLYDKYNVIEVDPLDIEMKKGKVSTIIDKNVIGVNTDINTDYNSVIIYHGKFIQEVPKEILTDPQIFVLCIYSDGSVITKPVTAIKTEEIPKIKIAFSGFVVAPKIRTPELYKGTNKLGNIFINTCRILAGYSPAKNKVIFVIGNNMSISEGKSVLQKVGCVKGIHCHSNQNLMCRIDYEYLIRPTNNSMCIYLTF